MTTPICTPDWNAALLYSIDIDLIDRRAHAASAAARAGNQAEAVQHLLVCQLALPGLVRRLGSLDITDAPALLLPKLTELLERRDALLATMAQIQHRAGG